ncbi:mevalonate kinase [Erwinia sp. CPCC 100877]|nr:mevalonate kinase [Erwinia sp. CPCC 100877]
MNKENTGFGSATGKIILMGEHSVVYGEPAIAFPFQETAIAVKVKPGTDMYLNCLYFSGSLTEAPKHLESIRSVIYHTLKELNHSEAALHIEISSTIPAERGMGSSAATAVAVVRALHDYFGVPCSSEKLLSLVNQAEMIAHGNPSGIDAAAASGDKPIYFIKGQALEVFPMNLTNSYLIVADTGIKGQTRAAVSDVAKLFEQDKKATAQHISTLGQLTVQAKAAILADDTQHLGQIMTEAQEHLAALTVSNDKLDQLIHAALSAGALGAKLTGGGRGGCMIALADSNAAAKKIATALTDAGAKACWIQSLEVNN